MTRSLTLSLAAALLWACGDGPPEAATPQTPVSARLHTVTQRDLPVTQTAAGSVRALERAELATRLAGRIVDLAVREGDAVTAGQVLVRVDDQDLTAGLAQARAGLDAAQAGAKLAATEARRAEALFAEEAISPRSHDQAIAAHRQAEAAVDAARRAVAGVEAQRAYGILRAPFNGVVVQRNVDAGDLAGPGMPLLAVERTDSVRVVAAVPESEAARLRPGDPVTVTVGQEQRDGQVHSVVPGGAGQRIFEVQVRLSADDEIRSGRFARVTFYRGTRSVVWLPAAAIVHDGQLQGAFVASGGRAVLRWLRLGSITDDGAEVLSGLSAGDTIAVPAEGAVLRDGVRLTDVGMGG